MTMTNYKRKTVHAGRLSRYMRNRPELQEGEIDGAKLTKTIIPTGTTVPIVSMRNAIFMNQMPTSTILTEPLDVWELSTEEHGCWMKSDPQEVWQMDEPIRKAKGRVLVGGLGLGVLSHLIALKENVRDVTTVEYDPRVIQLVDKFMHPKNVTTDGDLFDFLGRFVQPGQYDYAAFDIWQPTGEMAWQSHVVPLRRLMRNILPQHKIYCWNEAEMVGQIREVLPRVVLIDCSFGQAQGYYKVFRNVVREVLRIDESYEMGFELFGKAEELRTDAAFNRLLNLYVNRPGSPAWERTFGKVWDEYVTPYQEKEIVT